MFGKMHSVGVVEAFLREPDCFPPATSFQASRVHPISCTSPLPPARPAGGHGCDEVRCRRPVRAAVPDAGARPLGPGRRALPPGGQPHPPRGNGGLPDTVRWARWDVAGPGGGGVRKGCRPRRCCSTPAEAKKKLIMWVVHNSVWGQMQPLQGIPQKHGLAIRQCMQINFPVQDVLEPGTRSRAGRGFGRWLLGCPKRCGLPKVLQMAAHHQSWMPPPTNHNNNHISQGHGGLGFLTGSLAGKVLAATQRWAFVLVGPSGCFSDAGGDVNISKPSQHVLQRTSVVIVCFPEGRVGSVEEPLLHLCWVYSTGIAGFVCSYLDEANGSDFVQCVVQLGQK